MLLYIVFWISNYFRLQTIAFMRSWAKTEKLKEDRKGLPQSLSTRHMRTLNCNINANSETWTLYTKVKYLFNNCACRTVYAYGLYALVIHLNAEAQLPMNVCWLCFSIEISILLFAEVISVRWWILNFPSFFYNRFNTLLSFESISS